MSGKRYPIHISNFTKRLNDSIRGGTMKLDARII